MQIKKLSAEALADKISKMYESDNQPIRTEHAGMLLTQSNNQIIIQGMGLEGFCIALD